MIIVITIIVIASNRGGNFKYLPICCFSLLVPVTLRPLLSFQSAHQMVNTAYRKGWEGKRREKYLSSDPGL